MTIKVKSLVPSLGLLNNPIGSILEVDEATAARLVRQGKAELVQEKVKKPDPPKVEKKKGLDDKSLNAMTLNELREYAKENGIRGTTDKNKPVVIKIIKREEAKR